jgi:hypothetical protein
MGTNISDESAAIFKEGVSKSPQKIGTSTKPWFYIPEDIIIKRVLFTGRTVLSKPVVETTQLLRS